MDKAILVAAACVGALGVLLDALGVGAPYAKGLAVLGATVGILMLSGAVKIEFSVGKDKDVKESTKAAGIDENAWTPPSVKADGYSSEITENPAMLLCFTELDDDLRKSCEGLRFYQIPWDDLFKVQKIRLARLAMRPLTALERDAILKKCSSGFPATPVDPSELERGYQTRQAECRAQANLTSLRATSQANYPNKSPIYDSLYKGS